MAWRPSAAVEFNIWTSASLNDPGTGPNPGPNPGSVTAFATSGAILVNSYTTAGAHLTTPAVDMTSGDPIQVVLNYNGTAGTLTEQLTDTVDRLAP